jgi:zinc resistance-associated protein
MKKWTTITASLALTLTIAAAAWAVGPGYGMMGRGMGPGYAPQPQITAEQQAEFVKARAAFLKDTQALRQQAAAKRIELGALWAQPQPDQARIVALSNELVDLRAQLAKKRNQHLAQFPGIGAQFCGLGRGYGHGYGGRMGGRGQGGRGMMGFGPGNCWR